MGKSPIVYLVSFIIFLVATWISSYNTEQACYIKVASIIIAVLPVIYSLIPAIENYKMKKQRKKDELSQNTFTDRETDIKNILQKLTMQEHVIEISGNSEKCGKTWVAKKIADIVNKSSVYEDKVIKKLYKAAYYIDMEKEGEAGIDVILNDKLVNSKTILILDHVSSMDYILTKQAIYHFQLIYILKDNCYYNFFKHNISIFHEENICELQNNIRHNYAGIDDLNACEIQTLYNLTGGNIGKIHSMLSTQRCVQWIKDITIGNITDYDERLQKINMKLLLGKYVEAQKELEEFQKENEKYFHSNNVLYYYYILIKSDCEHLLNHYEEALTFLSIIEEKPYVSNNKNYELELCRAHYNKHLWKCDDALQILLKIRHLSYSAKVDSLGILLAKYFINDLHVPNSSNNSLKEFLNIYVDADNDMDEGKKSDALKCRRYAPAYLYYKNKPSKPDDLIAKITEVINTYESQNDRLLANAYFMRGEIYRLYEQYEDAIKDYSRTNIITHDNNITIQSNLIIFYLKRCKKIVVEFNLLSENEIINLCEKNNYAQIVWRLINSILLNDPDKASIIEHFDNRIMPIL